MKPVSQFYPQGPRKSSVPKLTPRDIAAVRRRCRLPKPAFDQLVRSVEVTDQPVGVSPLEHFARLVWEAEDRDET